MERVKNSRVSIKGTKDGLVFHLDDQVDFAEVLEELEHTLRDKQARLLNGPDVSVRIQLGKRQISVHEEHRLRELFLTRPNLIITDIESRFDHYRHDYDPLTNLESVSGTVRSGQVLETKGSLLLLGDVNPGGTIRSGGHIFILGALRGMAHAGFQGNKSAIIAASQMSPTQLRIADIISRSPDDGTQRVGLMEFAHLSGQQITIDQMNRLYQIRPELRLKTNWQLM